MRHEIKTNEYEITFNLPDGTRLTSDDRRSIRNSLYAIEDILEARFGVEENDDKEVAGTIPE